MESLLHGSRSWLFLSFDAMADVVLLQTVHKCSQVFTAQRAYLIVRRHLFSTFRFVPKTILLLILLVFTLLKCVCLLPRSHNPISYVKMGNPRWPPRNREKLQMLVSLQPTKIKHV